ncbi:MAG TPA: energy transducer TonB [Bacteroidia bacterium]|nr:energy transducer TonB [Bacteroidia bacterium]
MQLTGKEVNRNNRISLGVTIFSFVVLLLFLVFKNIINAKPSLASANPAAMSIALNSNDPYDFDKDMKNAGLLTGKTDEGNAKKEIAVTDDKIDAFNSMANELLEKYKAGAAKTIEAQKPVVEAPVSDLPGGTNKTSDHKTANANIGFDLVKRQLINAPAVGHTTNEEGTVILEIAVDQDGNVTEAIANGRGTTTNNTALKTKARQLALATKFTPAPGIVEQRGSITINFSFN